MIVELHMIQNFAPSCLNRDDTNSPKDCEFGGSTRARISSQCLKRSIRTSDVFHEITQTAIGIRTREIPIEIVDRLVNLGRPEEKVREIVGAFVPIALGKIDATMKSNALVYVSEDELKRMVEDINVNWDRLASSQTAVEGEQPTKKKGKKEEAKSPLQIICAELVKKGVLGKISPDIALFGRMMAERTSLNVEGAVQMAHAISTNRVSTEIDFYTAVDDLKGDEDLGAGMMGTVAYNSACFYRYCAVDLELLTMNLTGDRETAIRTTEAFIKASVAAIPSGKQNSMAAHNPPSLVLAIVRNGQPQSLTNAFVRPVGGTGTSDDIVGESIHRLDAYLANVLTVYGMEDVSFMGSVVLGDYTMDCSTSAGMSRYPSMLAMIEALRGILNGGPSA